MTQTNVIRLTCHWRLPYSNVIISIINNEIIEINLFLGVSYEYIIIVPYYLRSDFPWTSHQLSTSNAMQ